MSILTRLFARVRDVVGPAGATDVVPDERLAVAALLVHVARVDGRVSETERQALRRLVATRFGLTADAAERLVERADDMDREVDDVAALIEMMGHGLDGQERRRSLAMAYDVAGADGDVGEFEADLVWRLGRLLGFDDAEIEAIRIGAREAA